jgi:dipeptidyl aminopeptidase/acylaminoacyl peptidase
MRAPLAGPSSGSAIFNIPLHRQRAAGNACKFKPQRVFQIVSQAPKPEEFRPTLEIRRTMPSFHQIAGILLAGTAVAPSLSEAQRPDYARAEQFLSGNLDKRVFGDKIEPHWLKDGNRFWYRVNTPRGSEFHLVDPVTNTKRQLFDNAKLASAMSLTIDSTFEPAKLGFTNFELAEGEKQIDFRSGKRQFKCDIGAYKCALTDTIPDRIKYGVKSPDGKWIVYQSRSNLYIIPSAGGDSVALTTDGDSLRAYGIHPGPLGIQWNGPSPRQMKAALQWSPDSKKFVTERTDYTGIQFMPLYSSTSTRPKYYLYAYGLPGDSAIARFDLHVIDIEAKTNVKVQSEQLLSVNDVGGVSDSTGPVKWAPTSDKFFFISASRGAKRLAVSVADARTGAARRIVTDSVASPTGTVDLGPPSSSGRPLFRLTESENDVYWYSNRDGWGHLYRFDGSGKVRTQMTSGAFSVRGIDWGSAKDAVLYITIRGKEPDRFMYHNVVYRVKTDGTGMTLITPELANHSVVFSPSGKYFIDTYSKFDVPPVIAVRSSTDGKIIRELERADISRLVEIGWKPPEVFRAIGADGVSEIYGIIWRPSTFDSTRKYPLVDYIYPVPGANISNWGWITGGDPIEPRALAECGFIVTQIMARGTGSRSKSFLDAYQGRMGLNTVPDHVTALQQLGAKYHWIDLDRVGITGHSGGGFASAAAILRYPDFFKVAVSAAGNHDNRSYGAFWGEKYQGLYTKDPKTGKDNFEDEANYTLAKNLKGKLLLLHGDMDDNVHPAHTLRLAHALIAANKKFDMMIMPDRNHGLAEPYVHRLRFDYFVKHLMGVEPPDYTFTAPN